MMFAMLSDHLGAAYVGVTFTVMSAHRGATYVGLLFTIVGAEHSALYAEMLLSVIGGLLPILRTVFDCCGRRVKRSRTTTMLLVY